MSSAQGYDYVIVGGGTAGCVLASRLTEDPAVSVLLLEAGPAARSLWITMPAGMGRLFVNPTYNWGFMSTPEAHLDNRSLYFPQGKTLGGSSAINGMAFVRGHAEDYDHWLELGNEGWGWADVQPYFKKLERRVGPTSGSRGDRGPLPITDPTYRHPSSMAFVEAAANAGLPVNADFNGPSQEGASLLQYSIDRGRRQSAAATYLRAAQSRTNLKIVTEALVHRVLVEHGRAVGVAYEQGGHVRQARAQREVIVAAGAINSPRVLLHSGIGDARELESAGIEVQHDLPGVGSNLIDHPYVHMTFAVPREHSLNSHLRGWRLLMHGARWLLSGQGPLTIGASQAVAFVRSASATRPDIQINFRPISFCFDRSGRLQADTASRITAAICALRPQSVGRVTVRSADTREPPVITCNYLSASSDEDPLVAGVNWARRIFSSDPLRSRVLQEDAPGPAHRTDDEVRQFVRRTVQPMCHPVGTCRMGADARAVVDARLRVRGIEALRVIDASVMPAIVSGNTAAATYMLAEKAADLIKEEAGCRAPSEPDSRSESASVLPDPPPTGSRQPLTH